MLYHCIFRLGRTARAGKSGTGLLLLAPFEYDYMTNKELKDLPLQPVTQEEGLPRTASKLVSMQSDLMLRNKLNNWVYEVICVNYHVNNMQFCV